NKRKREAAEEGTEDKRYMKDLARLGCPSDLARTYKQSSHEPMFLNHRPLSSSGIPTELLHPIFGEFLDLCQNAEPTVEDYHFVNVLSEVMSEHCEKEIE
ncbi:425_t:CDS:1, partial [Paraglomus occultum]